MKDFEGTEGPVNFTVRGDVIVIDGVPGLIVLRSGKDFATIENAGAPRKQPALAALPANFDGDVLDRVEGDVEGAQSGAGADSVPSSAGARSRVVEIPPAEAR